MKIELSVSASHLPNVAGIGKGTSDPFAVLTLIPNTAGDRPVIIGKTEVIKNNLHPAWTKIFVVDYELGQPCRVIVSIVDEVRKAASNKPMGSALFEVGELLGARGNTKAKRLSKKHANATIIVSARQHRGSGTLRLKLKGQKLKNVEGWIGKSDPFFELFSRVDHAGAATWDNVYRSAKVKNNLDPIWEPATIELATLCGGELDAPVLIQVFDYESNGKHVSMGKAESTVNALVKAARSGEHMVLQNKGKDVGHLVVTQAQIHGHTAAKDTNNITAQMAGASISSSPRNTAAGNNKPTFVDYISGGCELSVMTAIDFTGSNGDPRKPGTLHYLHPAGSNQKNEYEKAISSICRILEDYDSDKMFPVVGFGAKYNGVINHCFQCGPSEEVHGVDAILAAYQQVFKSGLVMSGPTVFTEVIETAATRAVSELESAQAKGKQAYSILLIITDGAVSDVQATAQTIQSIADQGAPLSIVIVGVGGADFSAMEFLDDLPEKGGGGHRDIAQFVQMNKHSTTCSADLTSTTLKEIPDQLVDCFQAKGIQSLPPIAAPAEEEIVIEPEEEEIDLSLGFDEDEIVVSGVGSTVVGF